MFLNKYMRILICCCSFLALWSCRKDLGNYNYHEINTASIEGIEPKYTVMSGGILKIDPKLTFTQDKSEDTSKYSYSWFAMDTTFSPDVRYEIANTKNLNWQVTIPSIAVSYKVYYLVTEKSTGQSWRTMFRLNVTTNIADGWLVLNQTSTAPRLDFLNYLPESDSFQYYQDILRIQSSVVLKGNALGVYFYYRRDLLSGKIYRSIVVSTDQGTSIINTENNSFTPYIDLTEATTSYMTKPYYAQSVQSIGSYYVSYMLDNNGNLTYEAPTQLIGFGVPINRIGSGEKQTISPYYAVGYQQADNYVLMYDVEHKRFLEQRTLSNTCAVPASDGKLYDPGNMNMELLYMASSMAINGQTYAIFKNNAGKIYLTRIVCNSKEFLPQSFAEIVSPEIEKATQFAIDPTNGYVMYAAGGKVYRYNPFDLTSEKVLDYGNRVITLFKYQKMVMVYNDARFNEYAKKLIVATYDGTDADNSGKFDLYTVPNLNGELSLYKSYSGFGKIVDISYRERRKVN